MFQAREVRMDSRQDFLPKHLAGLCCFMTVYTLEWGSEARSWGLRPS
jgi:hypothetical protein